MWPSTRRASHGGAAPQELKLLFIIWLALPYTRGSLLVDAASANAGTAVTAMVMSGLVMVGLVLRPQGRILRVTSWVSIGLAAAYLINAVRVALAGT